MIQGLLYFSSTAVNVEKEGVLVFEEDYLFSSPSSAGSQVLGRNTNGWDKWKSKDGKTLDEVERK